jgi:hypothetical protein
MDLKELDLFPTNLLEIIKSYIGTYGPPINKTLGKEFLYKVVQCLSKNDYIAGKEYCVKYMNEDFYIVRLKITNLPIDVPKNIDYKYVWSMCDNYKSSLNDCDSDVCHYIDNNEIKYKSDIICSTNTLYNNWSDYNKKAITFESINHINTIIKYEGNDVIYISKPLFSLFKPETGSQYAFQMVFNYSQDDLNINLVLGAKQSIDYEIEKYKYDYSPICYNKNYFQDDFYLILKNCLINNFDIIEYKNIKYNIIDYKFCKINYTSFMCQCYYTSCSYMSKENFINIMPSKYSFINKITISCTPEWYIQLQISFCNSDNGYSARFILQEL